MEVVHRRCAGLDVHKATVVACVRLVEASGLRQEVRTFATTTAGLLALSDWLTATACTHAVLESTGVYWKPVWHVLEEAVTLVLANAAAVRNVPGRKSDVSDAMWLADLLAHGLIRGSFVPPVATQELRELTRTRKQLVREVSAHTQRIHKVLETANLKLAAVLSHVLRPSGRAILAALVAGETDPEKLADQAHPRLAPKRAALVEALHGRVRPHHRFLLAQHLQLIQALEEAIAALDAQIETAMVPFQDAVARLVTLPGVSHTVAHILLAEIGTDMSRFPTAGHLVSWAGLCPRMDESAGKHRSTRVRKGAPWLKPVLVQSAWAAVRQPDSYLRAQYLRLKSRRGPMKAIVAVAASLLTAAYHMLRDGTEYRERGAAHFTAVDKTHLAHRLARRLQQLGYHVMLQPAA
jgi:transposase